jgi:hypothetical protein
MVQRAGKRNPLDTEEREGKILQKEKKRKKETSERKKERNE